MSDFAHRERFATARGWRPVDVPTHRYRIRELSEEDTEWLVSEVYGILPAEWRLGWQTRELNRKLWAISEDLVRCLGPLTACSGGARNLERHDRAEIVFKAYRHLKNAGVVEVRRDPRILFVRNPMPADPLAKPSRNPCVRAAASLVALAAPVDESHVAVPQQMMRGLLSGALVR